MRSSVADPQVSHSAIRVGDVQHAFGRSEYVKNVVLVLLLSVVATACAGGGSLSSAPTPSTPESTSTSTPPAQAHPVRLVRGFGDEVGLSARFPLAWYAQPYG
jgi:hypothetical protein